MTHFDVAWAGLEMPWRVCLEEAWASWAAGSMGIGAAVVDRDGALVARGRNRNFEREGPPGVLANTAIAHAEINALAGLRPGAYGDHTLYTSLEPCLLCAGGIALAGVGQVHYLAADPVFDGLDSLAGANDFLTRRWPRRALRPADRFASFAAVLPMTVILFWLPEAEALGTYRLASPTLVGVAERLLEQGELAEVAEAGGTVEDAITSVWPALIGPPSQSA